MGTLMPPPEITPEERERIQVERVNLIHPNWEIAANAQRVLLGFIPKLLTALDRVEKQRTLEQTAANRTIEHLVTRKDALEAQVQALEGERDGKGGWREVVAKLRTSEHKLTEERDALREQVHDLTIKLFDLAQGLPSAVPKKETP